MKVYPISVNSEELFDERGNIVERLFVPSLSPLHRTIQIPELLVYNQQEQIVHLRRHNPQTRVLETDRSSLVVHIGSVRRYRHRKPSRASWCMYFGPGSDWNECRQLQQPFEQTRIRGVIEALYLAFSTVSSITCAHPELTNVRIACDSWYLVNVVAFRGWGWIDEHTWNSSRVYSPHNSRLASINTLFINFDCRGINVKMWFITREQNRNAHRLAYQALIDPTDQARRSEYSYSPS
ncbi:hypothetical protein F4677DRAFT_394276 [Hypoxylon crocopeplum]|nr:hypothetical protein F4677DRAFT_394276 [Hypoxylon crocopeplum]